jgi:hypothetical protein
MRGSFGRACMRDIALACIDDRRDKQMAPSTARCDQLLEPRQPLHPVVYMAVERLLHAWSGVKFIECPGP